MEEGGQGMGQYVRVFGHGSWDGASKIRSIDVPKATEEVYVVGVPEYRNSTLVYYSRTVNAYIGCACEI